MNGTGDRLSIYESPGAPPWFYKRRRHAPAYNHKKNKYRHPRHCREIFRRLKHNYRRASAGYLDYWENMQ